MSHDLDNLREAAQALLQAEHTVRLGKYDNKQAYSSMGLKVWHCDVLQRVGVPQGLFDAHEFGPDSNYWYSFTDAGERWMSGEELEQEEQPQSELLEAVWLLMFTRTCIALAETSVRRGEIPDEELKQARAFVRRARAVWEEDEGAAP